MHTIDTLRAALHEGRYDSALARLYGAAAKETARARALHVVSEFSAQFKNGNSAALFSGPGRTEIGGNHTDHQHGRVLCASVDMDMLACAAPNGLDTIRVISEGYPPLTISLTELEVRAEEKNTSAALVRGVAANIAARGYQLGGFDAYVTSNVLSGSGLSSSAAYEVLLGNIINHFFCGGALDAIELAKIGQYAENVYFGKPCGLMDQMGASVGGAVAIDFETPAQPRVKQVAYDFSKSAHVLCIVDSCSCHADLTDDYADITREMGAVSAQFGKTALRDVPQAEFFSKLPALRKCCGDRAVLRAIHYYEDDIRAAQEAQALEEGDFDAFLALVNESGISSIMNLQNIWSTAAPQEQAVSLVLAVGRALLAGRGAIRVHGGGFAGTVQAFVPEDLLEAFQAGMAQLLGEGKCHVLRIRPQGGCVISE